MSLTVLAPIIVCAFAMIPLVGMLVYVVVHRVRQARSPQGRTRLFVQARQWLNAQRSNVLPWRDEALTDISAAYSFQWHEFVTTHMTGSIQALSRPQPIVAFYGLYGPGLSCTFAATTAHIWQMEQRSGAIVVSIDDRAWGHCQDGRLFDAAGAPVGEADMFGKASTDLPWYNVTLNGRVIGAVLGQRRPHAISGSSPLLRPVAGITADEQIWLLTVALVDLSYAALNRSNTATAGPIM